MTIGRPFVYAERDPGPGLQEWVVSYWAFEVTEGAVPRPHHPPPDGCTSIAIIRPGRGQTMVMVSGPWLEPFAVPVAPGNRYCGIRLRPDTGGLVARTDPANLRNRSQPAAPLLGPLAMELAEAAEGAADLDALAPAFDRLLLRHVAGLPRPEPVARRAVARLWATRGELPVTALAAELEVAPRTLLRRFRAATGMTPKQYARIARFWAAARSLMDHDRAGWSRVAAETGYADQAHLTNEFADLLGLSPSRFEEHVRATRHDLRPRGGFSQDEQSGAG